MPQISLPSKSPCMGKGWQLLHKCVCTLYIYMCIHNRISSKSHHSKILFQGPVWCSDNSRAARFQGRHLQRLTNMPVHSFHNKPICMHAKCACIYVNCCRPLTMWRDFEGGIWPCWQIDVATF